MYLTWCALQWCQTPKFCSWNFLHQGNQRLLSLPSTRKKIFSFHFKLYNLTVHAINFFELFSHIFLAVYGKILQLKLQFFIFLFRILELEMADLSNILRKMTFVFYGLNQDHCDFIIKATNIMYFNNITF